LIEAARGRAGSVPGRVKQIASIPVVCYKQSAASVEGLAARRGFDQGIAPSVAP